MTATDRAEQIRWDLRNQALSSTYFMAKAVLGFKDLVPGFHGEMCRFIESPATRKLGLAPRDHLKTSVWTIADTVRRIAADPNIRILLGNETATNASHFLRRIEAVFERNEVFRWLFPELIPDFSKTKKWSETEMLVPRSEDYPESTVEAIGVGGAVVSRHYNLIKLDDLVGKEASESDEVMRKTIDWYLYCESLLVRPTDEIHTYGTRWSYHDLYRWIETHEPDCEMFHRSAIDAEGNTLWPERFDSSTLEKIRTKIGSFKFSCQYLNKPFDPEAASFHDSWLRYWAWAGRGEEGDADVLLPEAGSSFRLGDLRRFMRVDPAISERAGAARSAIIVDGVKADGRKFVLEAWAKRCQPFEMIEKIFEFNARYDCESVGFESVAYQRILKPILESEAERRGIWLNIIELKPDSRERKENRIRGLQPELERGNIWIRRDMEDLIAEYQQFPVGATVDLLDALAYGPHQWEAPDLDAEGEQNEEQAEFVWRTTRSSVTGY